MDERLEPTEVPLLQDPNNSGSRNKSNTRARWPWKGSIFILGAKFFERMAFYGVDTNLVTYLTGELNKSNAVAATISTTWLGTCNVTPLIGAITADAYLGRYTTMAIASTLYFIGLITLTSVSVLKLPSVVFYLGLYVMALGSGSFMPCIVAFGADQFDYSSPKERIRKSSFFNWFFFVSNFGPLLSSTGVVWVEDNVSWALGFGISTLIMGFAMGAFYSGTPIYRHQKPGGSPLTRICQVIVASLRKLRVQVPSDKSLLYEKEQEEESAVPGSRKLNYTDEFLCLDRAATISDDETKSGELCNGWRICTVTQVEEVKILLRMVPIWATAIIYTSAYAQAHTMFVEQGKTMNNSIGPHFKIPAASLYMFNSVTCMLWVLVYDFVIAPAMRKLKRNEKGLSELQRMGIGKLFAMFSMVCAALLEIKRLQVVKSHNLVHDADTPVPLSILWQIPQYVLLGIAETFVLAGQLEFFYEEAPDAMRTLCSALSHLSTAFGNYFSSVLVILVMLITTRGGSLGWIPNNLNEGHLDYYFWLWAALSLLNLAAYVAAAHRYRNKHVAHQIRDVLI
jgi:peptide/histidine transporter 3/4